MTPLILFLLFVIFAAILLRSFFIFDDILRKEYLEHPSEWEKDGKPIGFFWVPKGGTVILGSYARSSLATKWAFSVPTWAKSRPDLVPLFAKLKRSMIFDGCVWIASMVVLFTFPK